MWRGWEKVKEQPGPPGPKGSLRGTLRATQTPTWGLGPAAALLCTVIRDTLGLIVIDLI